jgi:hypothetical protein
MLATRQSWNRYAYVLNNSLSLTDPLGLWCVWEDGTHDDDPDNDGNATKEVCINQGGHWDPNDTIAGIFQQNGVITQINYTGGLACTTADCGAGETLDALDGGLLSYSVLPANNVGCSTVLPNGHLLARWLSKGERNYNRL